MKKLLITFVLFFVLNGLIAQATGNRIVEWGLEWENNDSVVNPPIPSAVLYKAIAAGICHNLALTADGRVVAWGYNSYNECDVPLELQEPNSCIAISAGFCFSLALKTDGTIVAWGFNDWGQCDVPTTGTYTKISAREDFGAAISSEGTIVAWGGDQRGPCNVPETGTYIDVAAGMWHGLALTSDRRVVEWNWGQSYSESYMPPELLEPYSCQAISAGWNYSIALTSDGRVLAWEQFGAPQWEVPSELQEVNSCIAISAGQHNNSALTTDGRVVQWGGLSPYYNLNPTINKNIIAVSSGYSHNLALKTVYTVEITSEPTNADILVNGVLTDWNTPYTFEMDGGTSDTYSVQMAEYTWEPESFTVNDIQANTSQHFIGTHHNPPIVPGVGHTIGGPNFLIANITVQTPPDTGFDIDYESVNINTIPPYSNNNGLSYHNSYAVILTGPNDEWFDLAVTVPAGIWWICAWWDDAWHQAVPDYPYIGDVPGTVYLMHAHFAGGKGQVVMIVAEGAGLDPTLPVELSSFTAIAAADCFVNLQWTTQSESNLTGYYIYRNKYDTLTNAYGVSNLIPATNSSQLTNYSFTDEEVELGSSYYYWLQTVEMDGSESYHGPISVTLTLPGEGGEPTIPLVTRLLNVYPNPFNPVTIIPYQLQTPETVQFSIYNSKGQLVRTYLRTHDTTGAFNLMFDGADANGKALSSGVYYCIMTAGKYRSSTKMVLLK